MQAISQWFSTALPGSFRTVAKGQLMSRGALVATIGLTSGNVNCDFTAQYVRQTSDLIIYDPTNTLSPTTSSSELAPNGNELMLFRGIEYTDPTVNAAITVAVAAAPSLYPYFTKTAGGNWQEYIPIGVLGISNSQLISSATSGWATTLTCYDRSRRVSRATFTAPTQFPGGMTPAVAIAEILMGQCGAGVVPGGWLTTEMLNFSADGQLNEPTVAALNYNVGDDPWKACQDIATGAGAALLFDAQGICKLFVIPDPATSAVVQSYMSGNGNGMVTFTRRLDDQYIVNYWTVIGTASSGSTPLHAAAINSDPSDPYSTVNYGEVGASIDSTTITTQDSAQAAADAQLVLSSGVADDIQWTGVVNPALDVYDVIGVDLQGSGLMVDQKYCIQTLTMPIDAVTAMQGTTRQLPQGS